MPHPILPYLLPSDVVFDVGALRGDKAELFRAHCARVVAVEPQPLMAARLAERFASSDNVVVVHAGLADSEGMRSISINSAYPEISTFSESWRSGRFRDHVWDTAAAVPVTTLDALIHQFGRPRFVKIDVEGYERAVIAGLSQYGGCLSFEFTTEYLNDSVAIAGRLASLGYRHFAVACEENATFDLAWTSAETCFDFVRARQAEAPLLWGDIYAC